MSRPVKALAAAVLLVALGVLVSVAEFESVAAVALFGIVVGLVAYIVYLVSIGEIEREARMHRISPAVVYLAIAFAAVVWGALRLLAAGVF